jgi:hypothetical protein
MGSLAKAESGIIRLVGWRDSGGGAVDRRGLLQVGTNESGGDGGKALGIFVGGPIDEERPAALVGLLHGGSAGEVAEAIDGALQKARSTSGDPLVNGARLAFVFGEIDEEMHARGEEAFVGDFDDAIGVEGGGNVGRGDDDRLVGDAEELHHGGRDSGAGIDEEQVELRGDAEQLAGETLAHVGVEIGHPQNARSSANEVGSGGAHLDDFVQPSASVDDIEKGGLGSDPGEDMGIGHAEIGIEEEDAEAQVSEGDGEVDGDGGLADTALAAGDGDDASAADSAGQFGADGADGGAVDEEALMDPGDQFVPETVAGESAKVGEGALDELNSCRFHLGG